MLIIKLFPTTYNSGMIAKRCHIMYICIKIIFFFIQFIINKVNIDS